MSLDPIPNHAFAVMEALLVLITDAKACDRRLRQLRAAQDGLADARRALADDQAAHAATVQEHERQYGQTRKRLAELIEQYERAIATKKVA